MEEAQRKRLYWHSRRGMWELDLMLMPFLERRFDELSDEDQQLYVTLLAEEDQDLFMWLMRREVPSDPELHRMVKLVINDAETSNTSDVRPI